MRVHPCRTRRVQGILATMAAPPSRCGRIITLNSPTHPDDARTPEPPAVRAHALRPPDAPLDPATHRRAMLAGLGGLAAGAFLTGNAHAGPLNPPPGPVTSTGKTLPEVEPRTIVNAANTPGNANAKFRITQGGSYYLTENFTGESGKHGIDITVSNVTLDLNGFTITGVADSLNGIRVSAHRGRNIVIRNGIVRGFAASGVFCEHNAGQPPQVTVERVHAMGNGADGMEVSFSSQVIDCVATENGAKGIAGASGCRIVGCHSRFNGSTGIDSGQGAVVIGCVSSSNGGVGITASLGSLVTDCNISFNNVGITATGTAIESCSFHNNTGVGVNALVGCVISHCTAYRNTGNGISGTQGTTVLGCSSYENGGNGISVGSSSTVQSCSARLNGSNGVLATNATLLKDNQCSSNGQGGSGAGVSVSGVDNRIEGNNCSSQSLGFNVLGTGNIITRNTASGNTTNWLFVANNYYGPIIDIAGTSTPTVSGSSANSTLGTTNAHANFTY